MAEIFAAVASGAGLLSLAIQLLESSQKLKGFYSTSKDAPQAVANLSFELEIMSLSLRQLETHRRADIPGDQLLGRCVIACTRMTAKVEAAVTKMEHLLKRSRGVGMVYTAFKEPEMRKLLEELEHAKSSMLFVYMSYCQSWNMREASNRATDVRLQNALLLSHQAYLQTLDHAVQTSQAAIIRQIKTSVIQNTTTTPSRDALISAAISKKRSVQPVTKRQPSRTFRLALPRWLTNTVWEFAMHECEVGWNFRIHPVNIREYGSFAFDIVRSGDLKAVRNLLATGELSVSDREVVPYGLANKSPLTIAAEAGHLDLCEFLLQEFASYRFDEQFHEALKGFLCLNWTIHRRSSSWSGPDSNDSLLEAFYKLFLVRWPDNDRQVDVHRSVLLTENALQDVIASQPIPFDSWPLNQRFEAAVYSQGWPADCFVRLVNFDSTTRLAQYKDDGGRTALHWAAEQLGAWMSHYDTRVSWRRNKDREEEYGKLLVKLITAGSDVHAIDSLDQTPFTCMILSCYMWGSAQLAGAIRKWGELLQKAGVSLQGFLDHENHFLAKLDENPTGLHIFELSKIWTSRLVVTGSSTLAFMVGSSLVCPIWKFHPPPGAWSGNSGRVDTIIWPPCPESDGHDWYLWQEADELVVKLVPKLLHEAPLVPSLAESISASWRELINGVQDDQGFVATTVRRFSTTVGKRKRRRRAASLPPPITTHGRHYMPVAESELYCILSRWLTKPHRCPLHLTWKLANTSEGYHVTDHRRCMQGRCDDGNDLDWRRFDDWIDSDHWEAQLLKDERNVDIARRFADRFRPKWRGIVEENHLRAKRRARLDIAVARA